MGGGQGARALVGCGTARQRADSIGASRCSRGTAATCWPLAFLGRRELIAPAAEFAIIAIGESKTCCCFRPAVCRSSVADDAASLQAHAALRRGVVAAPVSRARRSASAARCCFSMRRAFQRPSREHGTTASSCSGGSGVREQRCISWIGVVAA